MAWCGAWAAWPPPQLSGHAGGPPGVSVGGLPLPRAPALPWAGSEGAWALQRVQSHWET